MFLYESIWIGVDAFGMEELSNPVEFTNLFRRDQNTVVRCKDRPVACDAEVVVMKNVSNLMLRKKKSYTGYIYFHITFKLNITVK